LAPGTYRFRVIACNNDGVWTPKEEATSVSFAILPHFYQTFWFYLLCASVLGVALWLLARWHNALKHAQARSFEVGLDYEDDKRFRLYQNRFCPQRLGKVS
jgi:hypothetical protein